MKKNTFKRPVITYEPVQQPRLPLWMHSIDKPKTSGNLSAILLTVVALCSLLIIWNIFAY